MEVCARFCSSPAKLDSLALVDTRCIRSMEKVGREPSNGEPTRVKDSGGWQCFPCEGSSTRTYAKPYGDFGIGPVFAWGTASSELDQSFNIDEKWMAALYRANNGSPLWPSVRTQFINQWSSAIDQPNEQSFLNSFLLDGAIDYCCQQYLSSINSRNYYLPSKSIALM